MRVFAIRQLRLAPDALPLTHGVSPPCAHQTSGALVCEAMDDLDPYSRHSCAGSFAGSLRPSPPRNRFAFRAAPDCPGAGPGGRAGRARAGADKPGRGRGCANAHSHRRAEGRDHRRPPRRSVRCGNRCRNARSPHLRHDQPGAVGRDLRDRRKRRQVRRQRRGLFLRPEVPRAGDGSEVHRRARVLAGSGGRARAAHGERAS